MVMKLQGDEMTITNGERKFFLGFATFFLIQLIVSGLLKVCGLITLTWFGVAMVPILTFGAVFAVVIFALLFSL